jgi:hypothetical protein
LVTTDELDKCKKELLKMKETHYVNSVGQQNIIEQLSKIKEDFVTKIKEVKQKDQISIYKDLILDLIVVFIS